MKYYSRRNLLLHAYRKHAIENMKINYRYRTHALIRQTVWYITETKCPVPYASRPAVAVVLPPPTKLSHKQTSTLYLRSRSLLHYQQSSARKSDSSSLETRPPSRRHPCTCPAPVLHAPLDVENAKPMDQTDVRLGVINPVQLCAFYPRKYDLRATL